MLAVQKFLETKTFDQLETEWGVCARVSTDGFRVAVNYDQILSKPGVPDVGVCRGLILRKISGERFCENGIVGNVCPGQTKVMARAFDRFYNVQEPHSAPINWDDPNLKIVDKLDGTLCILYWNDLADTWCVATRSICDADLPIDGDGRRTFRSLFEEALQNTLNTTFDAWTQGLERSITLCFELTSPYNRIIVKYDAPELWLIGGRVTETGQEFTDDQLRKVCASTLPPGPKTWSLSTNSLDAVVTLVNSLKPEDCEGAVIIDGDFRRVKIKNLAWVLSNKVKSYACASKRNLLETVLTGVSDDVMAVVPDDIKQLIEDLQEKVSSYFCKLDKLYKEFHFYAGDNRKYFAEQVLLSDQWVTPFFNMYDKKSTSTIDFVQKLAKQNKLSASMLDTILRYLDKHSV